ncbi:MAG TPA: CopG family transcriptional regulator [Burkholderiaceae bacterium]|nr:CopG family transcriptional regulator [Burkholderiaceae bacterium]
MRTTLVIDDDILTAARHIAERDRRSVGEVISVLAREGLASSAGTAGAERNGIPLLPGRRAAVPVTPELVSRLRDELPGR